MMMFFFWEVEGGDEGKDGEKRKEWKKKDDIKNGEKKKKSWFSHVIRIGEAHAGARHRNYVPYDPSASCSSPCTSDQGPFN